MSAIHVEDAIPDAGTRDWVYELGLRSIAIPELRTKMKEEIDGAQTSQEDHDVTLQTEMANLDRLEAQGFTLIDCKL